MNAARPDKQSVRPPNRVSHRPVSLINGQASFLFHLNENPSLTHARKRGAAGEKPSGIAAVHLFNF